jgi:uncharacterized membrane protein
MPRRLPIAAFILTHIALGLSLAYSAQHLPPHVASHFNAAGVPDGWMPRSSFLWSIGSLGFGLALLLSTLFYVCRFFPDATFNLPHREYWLAPAHRAETCNAIFRAGLWLVSLLAAFQVGLQLLTVSANNARPPHLPSQVWLLLISLVAGLLVWAHFLNRRFSKIPDDATGASQARDSYRA